MTSIRKAKKMAKKKPILLIPKKKISYFDIDAWISYEKGMLFEKELQEMCKAKK